MLVTQDNRVEKKYLMKNELERILVVSARGATDIQ